MKDIIGTVGGILFPICFFICYVPQLIKTFKHKDVEGLSFNMFLLTVLGYASSFSYQFKIGFNPSMTINAISGTACCITIMILIRKYKRN